MYLDPGTRFLRDKCQEPGKVVTFGVTFFDSTEDYPSIMVTNGYLMIFHDKIIQDGFDGKNDQEPGARG